MTVARLPRMTNPMGKHWGQPPGLRDRVSVYETHAAIPAADWQALLVYDSSYPSGVYAGKAWRRGPFLCWYGRERDGSCCVGYARALVRGPGTNLMYRITAT